MLPVTRSGGARCFPLLSVDTNGGGALFPVVLNGEFLSPPALRLLLPCCSERGDCSPLIPNSPARASFSRPVLRLLFPAVTSKPPAVPATAHLRRASMPREQWDGEGQGVPPFVVSENLRKKTQGFTQWAKRRREGRVWTGLPPPPPRVLSRTRR